MKKVVQKVGRVQAKFGGGGPDPPTPPVVAPLAAQINAISTGTDGRKMVAQHNAATGTTVA